LQNPSVVDARRLNPKTRVDPELAAIIRACTHPDPARRYPNASALATDIRLYLEDRPLAFVPGGRWRAMVKWSVRHPIATGMILVLGIEALLLAAWWQFLR